MTVEFIPALTAERLLHLAVGSRVRWHDNRTHFGSVLDNPTHGVDRRLHIAEEGCDAYREVDPAVTCVFPLGRVR